MTVEDFKLLYPELSQSFIDEQIGSQIRMANLLMNNLPNFGAAQEDALGLMTAHLLQVNKLAGKHGTAIQTKTSKKVGDVSFTYATQSGGREWYALTSFGQHLQMLIDMQPKRFVGFVV